MRYGQKYKISSHSANLQGFGVGTTRPLSTDKPQHHFRQTSTGTDSQWCGWRCVLARANEYSNSDHDTYVLKEIGSHIKPTNISLKNKAQRCLRGVM